MNFRKYILLSSVLISNVFANTEDLLNDPPKCKIVAYEAAKNSYAQMYTIALSFQF